MKKTLLLLLFAVQALADSDNSLLFKGRSLDSVSNQLVAFCDSAGMEVIRQTTNSLSCQLLTTTVNMTMVRFGGGIRVTWTIPQYTYNGVPVPMSITDDMIRATILAAGKQTK
jgi:hypothetical protein